MAAAAAAAASAPTAATLVVSNPLAELLEGGRNVKHVRDCTELHLGNRGIEQLHGFEPLVNLEVLWLNGNRLSAITHLDKNVRLRELYVHDNEVCTLKGSLGHLKFLTQLDLSGNNLRELPKLLARLEKLTALEHLNLQGNPCCEEPDYRLHVIHRLPWVKVLDWHQVTELERHTARAAIGGDVAALTVAFLRRVPVDDAWRQRVPERSVLEQELAEAAMRVREARQEAQDRALAEAFSRNPDAAFWAPKATLPPPPGVLAAQAAWSHGSTGTGMGTSSQGSALTARLTQTAGALATGDPCSSGGPGPAGAVMGELTKGCTAHGAGDAWNKRAATGPGQTCGQRGGGGSSYVGKDLFVLHWHQVAAGASGVLRGATSGDKQRQFVGGAATAATAAGESEPSTTFSVAHCTFEPQWSLNSVQLRV